MSIWNDVDAKSLGVLWGVVNKNPKPTSATYSPKSTLDPLDNTPKTTHGTPDTPHIHPHYSPPPRSLPRLLPFFPPYPDAGTGSRLVGEGVGSLVFGRLVVEGVGRLVFGRLVVEGVGRLVFGRLVGEGVVAVGGAPLGAPPGLCKRGVAFGGS